MQFDKYSSNLNEQVGQSNVPRDPSYIRGGAFALRKSLQAVPNVYSIAQNNEDPLKSFKLVRKSGIHGSIKSMKLQQKDEQDEPVTDQSESSSTDVDVEASVVVVSSSTPSTPDARCRRHSVPFSVPASPDHWMNESKVWLAKRDRTATKIQAWLRMTVLKAKFLQQQRNQKAVRTLQRFCLHILRHKVVAATCIQAMVRGKQSWRNTKCFKLRKQLDEIQWQKTLELAAIQKRKQQGLWDIRNKELQEQDKRSQKVNKAVELTFLLRQSNQRLRQQNNNLDKQIEELRQEQAELTKHAAEMIDGMKTLKQFIHEHSTIYIPRHVKAARIVEQAFNDIARQVRERTALYELEYRGHRRLERLLINIVASLDESSDPLMQGFGEQLVEAKVVQVNKKLQWQNFDDVPDDASIVQKLPPTLRRLARRVDV